MEGIGFCLAASRVYYFNVCYENIMKKLNYFIFFRLGMLLLVML